jgi:tetratricopeptide (TPR) repeat protein
MRLGPTLVGLWVLPALAFGAPPGHRPQKNVAGEAEAVPPAPERVQKAILRLSSRCPGEEPSPKGTAFLISKNGLGLTAAHVVKEPRERGCEILAEGPALQIQLTPVEVLSVGDDKNDVALLRVPGGGDLPFLSVGATGLLVQGSRVVAYGHDGGKPTLQVHEGHVTYLPDGVQVPVAPGASGGPVLLPDCQLVVGIARGGEEGGGRAVEGQQRFVDIDTVSRAVGLEHHKIGRRTSCPRPQEPPQVDLCDAPLITQPRQVGFVHRPELDAILRQLGQPGGKPPYLWGLGGTGKTTLAIEAAYRLLEQRRLPFGVVFISLRAKSLEAIEDQLATALCDPDVMKAMPASRPGLFRRLLAARRPLVVFDDVPEATAAKDVTALLDTFPGVWALFTSRHHYKAGEVQPIEITKLGLGQAVELLRKSAHAVAAAENKEDPVSQAGAGDLQALAERLGFLPLALSVAAGLLVDWQQSPGAFLAELKKEGIALVSRDPDDERQNLSLYFRAVTKDLTPETQQVLRAVAAFPTDDVPLAGIEAVSQVHETREHVDRLVVRSLLQSFTTKQGQRRLRIHPLLQEVVRSWLMKENQLAALDTRAEQYWARWASETPQAELDRYPGDVGSVLAAFERAYAARRWQEAMDLAVGSRLHLTLRGRNEETVRLCEKAAAAAVAARDRKRQALFLHEEAITLVTLGNVGKARQLYEQALRIWEQIGDAHDRAATLHQLGILEAQQGNVDKARQLYEQSLRIKEQIGNARGRAATINQLGILEAHQGNVDKARQLYEQALRIWEQIGDAQGRAGTLHQQGILEAQQGNIDKARQLYEQALRIWEQIGDAQGRSRTLHQLAILEAQQDNVDKARQLYEQSLRIKEQVGDAQGHAYTLHQLAILEAQQDNVDKARQLYEQALRIWEQIGDARGRAATLHQLAGLELNAGRLSEAKRLFEQTLAIGEQLQDAETIAKGLEWLGLFDWRAEQREAADAKWNRALVLYEKMKATPDRCRVLAIIAEYALTADDTTRAERALSRLGQADHAFDVLDLRAGLLRRQHRDWFKAAQGIVVTQVQTDTPAARIGLMPGDILLQYGDLPLGKTDDLIQAIETSRSTSPSATAIPLLILRPPGPPRILSAPPGRLGVAIRNIP